MHLTIGKFLITSTSHYLYVELIARISQLNSDGVSRDFDLHRVVLFHKVSAHYVRSVKVVSIAREHTTSRIQYVIERSEYVARTIQTVTERIVRNLPSCVQFTKLTI